MTPTAATVPNSVPATHLAIARCHPSSHRVSVPISPAALHSTFIALYRRHIGPLSASLSVLHTLRSLACQSTSRLPPNPHISPISSCRSIRPVPAMARTPRGSSKRAAEADIESNPASHSNKSFRLEGQLRRSSRHQPKSMNDTDEARLGQGKMLGVTVSAVGTTDETAVEERKKTVKEGVQIALEGLARMERRLKSATKKQKLQVAETRFAGPPEIMSAERPPENILQPESVKEACLRITEPEERGQPATRDEDSENRYFAQHKGMDPESKRIDAPEESADVPERGAARPPPINSAYLPLPWKGRLGYACLNTYLRSAKTPVFCSRTCRMASITDHNYPLRDPSEPEHPVRNRPDQSKEPNEDLGRKFVQDLGLANARDIVKMLRWNDKYGIKFLRLSSEIFPFASHEVHGYKLAPFASEVLAETGRVAAELGHRLTTHPGQFTQLGSPREKVIETSIRDLDYHDEMLSLLRLPEQQNRDAVMVIHMGGTYGDKAATLDRFRKNYARLSPSVKARLVLENDDVAWSVHDLLPICEELNIPLVLDYHHHNIIFDSTKCREGTYDISQPQIQDRIAATWRRKGIRQKMHYSEPCPGAVTPRDRRKHSPRVMTLPPCPPDMDLMIEAKDKEQAVFELMRNFKLPGFERINDMIPHEREDEPRAAPQVRKKKQKPAVNLKRKRAPDEDPVELNDIGAGAEDQSVTMAARHVPDEDISMGGPTNRVYWPPGKEDWLKSQRIGGGKAMKTGEMGADD
ncbi:UV-damage endonuclease [Madurella fahalii]|uniref:UV-damage endonuclease n=1 Tax=Madurella fahalii TaxID=1157608 RepID=A0ABQ0G865_9PEZI